MQERLPRINYITNTDKYKLALEPLNFFWWDILSNKLFTSAVIGGKSFRIALNLVATVGAERMMYLPE